MHLFLLPLFAILKISCAISGVIWSKKDQNFVPLFSIATFSAIHDERVERFREIEYHNFNGEVLKISYFQETNLVNYMDNDTRISGVCGEIWVILSDYLNFTLAPIKQEHRNFGLKTENGSYDGILGMIEQNISQIIPRTGVFPGRLDLVDYTLPLWNVRYYLYIKPEWQHDEAWMFHLFKIRVWMSFIFMLLVLAVVGYLCEQHSTRARKEKIHYNLQDHIFYTVAIASSKGNVPLELQNKSRIIYICTSMFSWVIMIAFSSNAIFLMMNKKFILPFKGLRSLIRESKYDVVAFRGSMIHQEFKETVSRYYKYVNDKNRVSYADSAGELYHKVCFTENQKLAAFEAEDRHKAIGKNICRLVPTATAYFETWVASAIKKGFKYKRSFDTALLKMSETGLIDGLRDRWLDWKLDETEDMPFQSIDMSQVDLIFALLFAGLTASMIILLIEKLTFCKNQTLRRRRKKAAFQIPVIPKGMSYDGNRIYFTGR